MYDGLGRLTELAVIDGRAVNTDYMGLIIREFRPINRCISEMTHDSHMLLIPKRRNLVCSLSNQTRRPTVASPVSI